MREVPAGLLISKRAERNAGAVLNLASAHVRSDRKTRVKKLGVNNVVGLTLAAVAVGIARFAVSMAVEQAESMESPRGSLGDHGRARVSLAEIIVL